MAQSTEWLLLISEDQSSNSSIALATIVEHFLLLAVEITEVKKKRPGVAFKMHTVMNQSELLFTKAL